MALIGLLNLAFMVVDRMAQTRVSTLVIECDRASQLVGHFVAASAARALAHSAWRIECHAVDTESADEHYQPACVTLQGDVLMHLLNLGVQQSELFNVANGMVWLANRYIAWNNAEHDCYASIAKTGVDFGAVNFVHHFSKAIAADMVNDAFDTYSLNVLCAKQGVFSPPVADPGNPLSTLEYGLTLDAAKLSQLLRTAAEQSGVVFTSPDDRAGNEADKGTGLVIDCTTLPSNTGNSKEALLPVDSVIETSEQQSLEKASLFAQFDALKSGVSRTLYTSKSCVTSHFYSQKYWADGNDAKTLANCQSPSWDTQHNRVTLGLTGACQLSLDAGLAMRVKLMTLLWQLLPSCAEVAPSVIGLFNRQSSRAYDFLVDTIKLPYALAKRSDSDFWQTQARQDHSSNLRWLIECFNDTGVIPAFEHYDSDNALIENCLMAFEHFPSCFDPMVQTFDNEQLGTKLSALKQQFQGTVNQLPSIEVQLKGMRS